MLNGDAKKTARTILTRFFVLPGTLLMLILLQAPNKAYALNGFDNPNQVCQNTANLELVQNAVATIKKKFSSLAFGQPCKWSATTVPNVIESAKWYFRNYTNNGQFKQGTPLFYAVLDLKYACERSGGQWGTANLRNGSASNYTNYVVCQYYPKW